MPQQEDRPRNTERVGTEWTLSELGMHVLAMRDQLDRIERRQLVLIEALATEDDAEDITHDLDGNPVPESRPEGEEL